MLRINTIQDIHELLRQAIREVAEDLSIVDGDHELLTMLNAAGELTQAAFNYMHDKGYPE
ncbi:hypothetical protein KKE60_04430 [Patescibacteria group bacterium]|nr:hypothetical protein [Patescibacteria group bacterium]